MIFYSKATGVGMFLKQLKRLINFIRRVKDFQNTLKHDCKRKSLPFLESSSLKSTDLPLLPFQDVLLAMSRSVGQKQLQSKQYKY